MPGVSGYLLLDKPSGCTSAELTRAIAARAGGIRCGHLGTLDPMATGLLVICLGEALKLVSCLQRGTKRYLAEIAFGRGTDTYDREGTTISEGTVPDDLRQRLSRAIPGFTGTIEQCPPPYSAVKIGGRRAHDLARAGRTVAPAPRPVTIYEFAVKLWHPASIVAEIACSAGTYIRSLAHDLGRAIGCPAHLVALRRTQSLPFDLAQAISPEPLLGEGRMPLWTHVKPISDYLPLLPRLVLDAEGMVEVGHGRPLPLTAPGTAGPLLLMTPDGALLAVGESLPEESLIRVRRLLRQE